MELAPQKNLWCFLNPGQPTPPQPTVLAPQKNKGLVRPYQRKLKVNKDLRRPPLIL